MSNWAQWAIFVAAAAAVACARVVHAHVTHRRALATIERVWGRFWAGRAPLFVTIVGARGARVVLGTLAGAPDVRQQDVVSAGFTVRSDDGRVVDVAPGTRVTVYASVGRVDGDRLALPAGTRLMTALDEAIVDGDGPLRRGGGALRVPADLGLILSDRDLRPPPMRWTARAVRLDRCLLVVGVTVGLLAAGHALPRLLPLSFVVAFLLLLDAALFRGTALWLACTRPVHAPPAALATAPDAGPSPPGGSMPRSAP
jgi:hypothetical protein